jgi:hypothetical protein
MYTALDAGNRALIKLVQSISPHNVNVWKSNKSKRYCSMLTI